MSDTPVSENPIVEEKVEEQPAPEPIKKPKKSSKKKEVPVPVPVVEEEEEEEEALPTLIIHKRHKKSKPRKIIVITDDNSEPNSEDEEIPYRKRQEVVVKSKPAVKPVKVIQEKPAKATKPKFIPEAVEEEEDNVVINKPAAPKKPINVGHEGKIVGGKPSAPMTRAYLNTTQAQVEIAKKQTVTGDEWLDKLFNL